MSVLPFAAIRDRLRTNFRLPYLIAAFGVVSISPLAEGSTCTSFSLGQPLGIVELTALQEASGLAVSRRNPGVIYTHNDGTRKKVFALNLQGQVLVRFDFGLEVQDVEDIAAGPGPEGGVQYLYVADTGGAAGAEGVRNTVRVLRIPEPVVNSTAPSDAPSVDFAGVAGFTLSYPDGAYDTETLLVDPLNSDILLITKQNNQSRIYRANLNSAVPGSTVNLAFAGTVAFSQPSSGDISPDGTQILLRREEAAAIWNRTGTEPVETALARPSTAAPVIGLPVEPNGEGIAFLPDGAGYLTISEGASPALYYFQSQCPHAPFLLQGPIDSAAPPGGTITLTSNFAGFPEPSYVWTFQGNVIPGQITDSLTLSGLTAEQAGVYSITATNASGSATASASVVVQQSADVRLTELQSQPAGGNPNSADWWELTNFSSAPVSVAGWRFNDLDGGLATAFTLPTPLTLAPGESVVFVEGLTADQFRAWWGPAAIPAGLQIITYSGSGLAFAAGGDGFRLWNSSATVDSDTAGSVDFGPSTAGVTFTFDPATGQFGGLSQAGVNGAVQAAVGGDIGSPGKFQTGAAVVAPPPITIALISPQSIRLSFPTTAGQTYLLQTASDPAKGPWTATGDSLQATDSSGGQFERPIAPGNQFFRLIVP